MLEKHRATCKQFLKFLAAGVFNTASALIIYWAALALGAHYWLASGISLVLGIAISFRTHSRFVFVTEGKFVRFVCVWLVVYVLNILGLRFMRTYVGDYYAPIVLLPLNVALSYGLSRVFVFRSVTKNP